MYYNLKLKYNIGAYSVNEAKEKIAKLISMQGNSAKRQVEIKMLVLTKLNLEETKNGDVNHATLRLRFDISDKTLSRISRAFGDIYVSKAEPIMDAVLVEANRRYDNKFYSIKTKI